MKKEQRKLIFHISTREKCTLLYNKWENYSTSRNTFKIWTWNVHIHVRFFTTYTIYSITLRQEAYSGLLSLKSASYRTSFKNRFKRLACNQFNFLKEPSFLIIRTCTYWRKPITRGSFLETELIFLLFTGFLERSLNFSQPNNIMIKSPTFFLLVLYICRKWIIKFGFRI